MIDVFCYRLNQFVLDKATKWVVEVCNESSRHVNHINSQFASSALSVLALMSQHLIPCARFDVCITLTSNAHNLYISCTTDIDDSLHFSLILYALHGEYCTKFITMIIDSSVMAYFADTTTFHF